MKDVSSTVIIFFRTLINYFLAGCVLLVTVLPLFVVLLVLPERYCRENRLIFWLLSILYNGVVGALLVPISVQGSDTMPQRPAIIVANHQSALDIPVVGSVLQRHPHVWYALAYYVKVPVLGFFIRRIGIPVDQDNGATAARSLRQGIKFAQTHESHIIIFPEGGRYNDGTVHEFMHGFVVLARLSSRPVVPIYMPFNGRVYPPHSFLVYRHPIRIVIGPEFLYTEQDTDETFVQKVHAWFDQQSQA